MDWLDEIEKRCFPSEDSDDLALAPTWDQTRKLVSAVRLAEEGWSQAVFNHAMSVTFLSDAEAGREHRKALIENKKRLACFRSGEVEEKS